MKIIDITHLRGLAETLLSLLDELEDRDGEGLGEHGVTIVRRPNPSQEEVEAATRALIKHQRINWAVADEPTREKWRGAVRVALLAAREVEGTERALIVDTSSGAETAPLLREEREA